MLSLIITVFVVNLICSMWVIDKKTIFPRWVSKTLLLPPIGVFFVMTMIINSIVRNLINN